MSEFNIVIEFPDYAIKALRRGEWVVINLEDDLCCKVTPYSLDEQLADELDEKEVIFQFEATRKPQD